MVRYLGPGSLIWVIPDQCYDLDPHKPDPYEESLWCPIHAINFSGLGNANP